MLPLITLTELENHPYSTVRDGQVAQVEPHGDANRCPGGQQQTEDGTASDDFPPPTVSSSTYAVASGGTLNLPKAGVLYNAQDSNGDALTAQLVSGPSNGTFTYTPNAGLVGNGSFTYKANDGTSLSAVATVTINVLTNSHSAQDQDAQIIQDADVNLANASLAPTALDNEQNQLAEQLVLKRRYIRLSNNVALVGELLAQLLSHGPYTYFLSRHVDRVGVRVDGVTMLVALDAQSGEISLQVCHDHARMENLIQNGTTSSSKTEPPRD